MSVPIDPEIRQLLHEIQGWMVDNDYECGKEGSELLERIERILHPAPEEPAEDPLEGLTAWGAPTDFNED